MANTKPVRPWPACGRPWLDRDPSGQAAPAKVPAARYVRALLGAVAACHVELGTDPFGRGDAELCVEGERFLQVAGGPTASPEGVAGVA
jgi:hypothetical protein